MHYFAIFAKKVHLKIKGDTAVLAVLFLFSGLFLARCARPGTPAGGPKDEEPPVIVSAIPPNRTVFFDFTKATLSFDEFIQLKNPSKEIFISPPMKTRPEFKVQGKKLIIEFKEGLRENSTYTINFGNALIDYTESNPLENFEYVFSTGAYIDSLSIPGKVLNALDHKPEPEILVMVYQDDNDTIPLDSLPFRVQPKSASKTTKEGVFRINNLAVGKYKLFALEDLNNNYIFDLPNERIAFLDSLVTIYPPDVAVMSLDSADTAMIAPPSFQVLTEDSYTLFLFQEADTVQKLLGKKLFGRNLLQYIFRLPADSIRITPVDFQPDSAEWYLTEFGKMKDTVSFWLKPGLPDTMRICLNEGDRLTDTTRFIVSGHAAVKTVKRREEAKDALVVLSNVFAGSLDFNKNLQLFFPVPVKDFEPSLITLYTATDTIIPVFEFSDSLQKKGEIRYKFLPGEIYQVLIEDSAFCDLGGLCNDSTNIRFKVRSAEDYGLLLLNLILPDTASGQYIIQLMNDKEIVVREEIATKPGVVRFEYLMAGNYKLKVIFDTNANSRWDTGNYGANSLPERVEYYTPAVIIRANWDLQEDWPLTGK